MILCPRSSSYATIAVRITETLAIEMNDITGAVDDSLCHVFEGKSKTEYTFISDCEPPLDGGNPQVLCECCTACSSKDDYNDIHDYSDDYDYFYGDSVPGMGVGEAAAFACSSGDLVYQAWVCNGYQDCDDGSDEVDCDNYICTDEQYRCDVDGNSVCIPACGACGDNWLCDGEPDCDDESDELACPIAPYNSSGAFTDNNLTASRH